MPRENDYKIKLNDKEDERKDTLLEFHAKNSVAELFRMYIDRDWEVVKKEAVRSNIKIELKGVK